MIRRPPRSTPLYSSAASDVYKRQPSGIYDLGTSNPTSFQEVGELVAKKYNGTIEYIPFPEHLKGKYQTYTCAKKEWDNKFMSVKEYLQL